MSDQAPLALRLDRLHVGFRSTRGWTDVLHGISLEIKRGEIFGLVGESGSGKSVTAGAAMGLLPPRTSRVTARLIEIGGRDVTDVALPERRKLCGKVISLIPQEPLSALNPTMRISEQMRIVLKYQSGLDKKAAYARCIELLAEMQIADPERVLKAYPFELSGGLRQRVLIALAFAGEPDVIVADEPTTALDVSVQAEILSLLQARAKDHGTAVLFITHDMGVVWQICDRIAVMRKGEIVETGSARDVLTAPEHAYTQGLLAALPGRAARKTAIAGEGAAS